MASGGNICYNFPNFNKTDTVDSQDEFVIMSLVKSYLRREILLPFFYALLVLVFILLLGQLFKIVNMVVSEGVRIWDVMNLVLAMIPQMLTMALPLAFFFAVLAGVGRLVGDGEVTALQAAGISPYQMLTPILQLAIACTMLTMLMSAWLAPWGIRQVRKVTFAILQDKVTLALRPQSLNLTFPGMTIYLGDIDKKSGRLNSVFIEDHRKSEAPQTITALTGRLVSDKPTSTLSLELENGTIHEYNQLKESYRITDFSKYKVNFEISALLGEKSHVGMKNKSRSNYELLQKIAKQKENGESPARSLTALYERFTQPFACIAFALLGVALVLRPVRSGARSRGFVFGLCLILTYHLTNLITEYMVEWKPSLAFIFILLPNLIFISLGIFLMAVKQNDIELSMIPRWRIKTTPKDTP